MTYDTTSAADCLKETVADCPMAAPVAEVISREKLFPAPVSGFTEIGTNTRRADCRNVRDLETTAW